MSRWLLLAMCAGCFSQPSYEGKTCDINVGCPGALVCSGGVCLSSAHLPQADGGTANRTDGQTAVPPFDAQPDAHLDAQIDPPADGGHTSGHDAAHHDAGSSDAAAPGDASTSAPDACEPVPEICNGLDDDCDGVIDNGCPLGPVVYEQPAVSTPISGGGAATVWTNTGCPPGQVVIGFHGRSGTYLDQLGETCGTPVVAEDRSVTPFRYALHIIAGASEPGRGGTGGGAFDGPCPAGHIVSAVNGHSGTLIDQFGFSCARFDVAAGTAPDGRTTYAIDQIGSAVAQPVSYGGTGGSPFMLACPLGYAAYRTSGSDGPYTVGMQTFTYVGSVGADCIRLVPVLR